MIKIENLTKHYDTTRVVDDVSLVIERNSVTAIVGTSGAGKSTLLRMINRLVEPSSGRVLLNGIDTRAEPAHRLRRHIGYVIQGYGLFPHRTVAQNIATVPRLLGWDAQRIRTRVGELLEIFQLDPAVFATKLPHQLSGGQQQRVGVARALAAEPAVVLMDEPFAALDPIIRAKAQEDLRAIQRRFGTTIVLVTHDIDEAFRLANKVAVMSEGRVVQYDRPGELIRNPADSFVARMIGISDRAMRLLSLTSVGEVVLPSDAATDIGQDSMVSEPAGEPGASTLGALGAPPDSDGEPIIASSASLRDALSELLWRGVDRATVVDGEGGARGSLTMAAILARGRRVPDA